MRSGEPAAWCGIAASGGLGAAGERVGLRARREHYKALIRLQPGEVGHHHGLLLFPEGPDIAMECEIEFLRAPCGHFGSHCAIAGQTATQDTDHASPARQVEPEDSVG